MSIEKLDKAFDRLFPQAKKYELYRFISGIFCLSRLTFQNDANELCVISSPHLFELVAELLSMDSAELNNALTKRTLNVPVEKGETIRYIINRYMLVRV